MCSRQSDNKAVFLKDNSGIILSSERPKPIKYCSIVRASYKICLWAVDPKSSKNS